MTTATIVQIIVQLLIMAAWFGIGWNIRALVEARRERKRAERAIAGLEEAARRTLHRLAKQYGGFVGTQIAPDEIRAGDEIHWRSPDGCEHIDYTAGFHGDVAGQTTGKWVRKDQGEDTP